MANQLLFCLLFVALLSVTIAQWPYYGGMHGMYGGYGGYGMHGYGMHHPYGMYGGYRPYGMMGMYGKK
ncbi:hypothetical protein QR680_005831 [Steinernema hermaphroditum]|uniref:Uncharacterized protein n=1 Tax=Steinernema hermaphroditum TaxID=289476 RepID=A0AA39LW41_9BILA|nr:hypothetical protein QR680_005831 [Steinernema hermaphroditum]